MKFAQVRQLSNCHLRNSTMSPRRFWGAEMPRIGKNEVFHAEALSRAHLAFASRSHPHPRTTSSCARYRTHRESFLCDKSLPVMQN